MTAKTTVQRVWRETIASYGPAGIARPEALESATATLMVEVRAGRLEVDVERALRAQLTSVDEADGRAADSIIERAAYGQDQLLPDDLDVVVTLGRGMRKAWRDITPEDIEQMIEVRYENYRKVWESFDRFNQAARRVRMVVAEHGTVGAAWEAGGFPPEDFVSAAETSARMNASTGPQPRVETEKVAARVERPQHAPRAATVITTLLALLPALAFFAADIARMTIERAAGLPGLPSGITLIGLGFAVAWLYGIGAFQRQFWISAVASPEHPESLSRLDRLDGVGTHTPRNAQTHP